MPVLFPDPQSVKENLVSTEAGIRQLADIIDVAGDPVMSNCRRLRWQLLAPVCSARFPWLV